MSKKTSVVYDSYEKLICKKLSLNKLQKNETSQNPFTRFFRKVTTLFSPELQCPGINLNGRISEFEKTTEEMLVELQLVKEWLKTFSNPLIYSLGVIVLDPMIKENLRFQKKMEQKSTTASQVKTVSNYVEWVEKARVWIELMIRNSNEKEMQELIVTQTIEGFEKVIARDIQILQDYLNHATKSPSARKKYRFDLESELLPTLKSIFNKLYALQDVSKDISLDFLNTWKLESDNKRESYFGEALHTIDSFFSEK